MIRLKNKVIPLSVDSGLRPEQRDSGLAQVYKTINRIKCRMLPKRLLCRKTHLDLLDIAFCDIK